MNSCIWILAIASSCQFTIAVDLSRDSPIGDGELVFAHVIFRHGERNIERTFPSDIFGKKEDEATFWPGGFGALTNAGKREVYELGHYLRQRYQKLIGNDYSPNKVYIRSTDSDRTLMSAQALAAGLFPPISSEQIWHEKILSQLVPIHTIPLTQEHLLAWRIPCPKFQLLFAKQQQSTELKSILEKYRPSIEFWEKNIGAKLNGTVDIMYLYDTLYVENRRGLPLPEWANIALNSNHTLEYLAAVHLELFTHTTELKQLEAGFIIKEMLDRFEKKSQLTLQPNSSLWIYAAHDLSLVNILNALDLYELHIPKYASSVHFELFRQYSNGQHYVEISYKKSSTEDPQILKIPSCGGTKCLLKRFSQLYRHILPTESYESLCSLGSGSMRLGFSHPLLYFLSFFTFYSMVH